MRRQSAQEGQALVFTLLFGAAAGLICLLLYNSGMLANTKTQLQNAADAAAYSGAVLLARDHNFSAYMNRAMVANQVGVAQLVSVKSYLQDAADTQRRMSNPLHTRQAQYASIKVAWQAAKTLPVGYANNTYSSMASGAVRTVDAVIRGLALAQNLHHQATFANVVTITEEVARRTDPQASVTRGAVFAEATTRQLANWNGYTRQHSANNTSAVANRFADVVVSEQSTDAFTRDRHSTPSAQWYSVPTMMACPGAVRPLFTWFSFEHRGGTFLSANKRRWLGLDATRGSGWVVCLYPNPVGGVIPIPRSLGDGRGGSGGAVAGQGGGYGGNPRGYQNNPGSSANFGGALTDSDTRQPARDRFYTRGPGPTLDSQGGLQDYYRDVTNVSAGSIPNQSPERNGGQIPLTVELARTGNTIRTAQQVLGTNAARIALQDQMKGDRMRALSSAHAYFYRPRLNDASRFTKNGWARQDRRTEVANLFNPYWQARLTDTPADAMATALGAP